MRLLIVEDHIAFLEGIEEYLTKNLGKDWTIESASTGNGALHKFNSGDAFDILLTDLNLPGLNGSKLVDQLKKRYPSLKVIILTMYYSRAIVSRLKALEISAFLTKNVSREEILDTVANIKDTDLYITDEIKGLFTEYDLEDDSEELLDEM